MPPENRGVLRLHRPDFDSGVLCLEHLSYAAQCAARSDSGAESVNGLGRLLHDFESRSVAMRRRIGGVRKLFWDEYARVLFRHALGDCGALFDCRTDMSGIMHENDVRTVVLHELAALFAHAVGHYDDRFISFDGSDEGKPDSLVAACRLDDDGIGFEKSTLFGFTDHVCGGARLYGSTYVQGFEFHKDFRHFGRSHAVQAHQRRVPHCIKYRVADHGCKL